MALEKVAEKAEIIKNVNIFGRDVISIKDHFPNSTDPKFRNLLTVGPMSRYAKDLPTLVHVMAGDRASKLRLDETVYTRDIRIHYLEDFGFNLALPSVDEEIKIAMFRAVQYFKDHGLHTERADLEHVGEVLEIALCKLQALEDVPDIFENRENPKEKHSLLLELGKAMIGKSQFTLAGVVFNILFNTKYLFSREEQQHYLKLADDLKQQIIDTLGTDGVLFLPSYPTAAPRHYQSFGYVTGVTYSMLFNALGLPGTQVPLGFNKQGLPIGIQVVAAPYQDRLGMCIARELEAAFGGWRAPQ